MEGELLEEVVVDAGAGVDAHAARAVEAEADARCASRRSRAGAATRRAAGSAHGCRPVEQPGERLDDEVVVLAVADRDPDRRRRSMRTTSPWRSSASPSAQAVVDRHEEEVRLATAAARARSRAATTRAARAPRRPARRRAATASAASASAAESVETGAGACRAFSSAASSRDGERVADARAGERERLREGAQHDHVAVVDERRPPSRRSTRSTPRRRRAAARRAAARRVPSGLPGRQANVSTGSSSPTSAPASCAAMR